MIKTLWLVNNVPMWNLVCRLPTLLVAILVAVAPPVYKNDASNVVFQYGMAQVNSPTFFLISSMETNYFGCIFFFTLIPRCVKHCILGTFPSSVKTNPHANHSVHKTLYNSFQFDIMSFCSLKKCGWNLFCDFLFLYIFLIFFPFLYIF